MLANLARTREVLPGRININSTNLASSVDFTCNVINQCGFPYGSTTNAGCVLVPQWASIGQAVPANVGEALCMGPYGGNTTSCDRTDWRQVGREGNNTNLRYACKAPFPAEGRDCAVLGHGAWPFVRGCASLAWSTHGNLHVVPYTNVFNNCSTANRQATVSKLDDKFSSWEEDQYKPALSVLFNIFICTQVG